MKRNALLKTCLAIAIGLGCGAASAQRNVAVFGSIGTGIGIGAATPITDSLNLRADIMLGRLNRDFSTDEIDYDGRFRLRNVGVYGDWRPFNGNFRTSLGLMWSDTRVELVGVARGGTFTFNGQPVSAAGESVTATAKMPSLRPYLGIGWGLADLTKKGFTWGVDLGVAIGKPKTDLQVSPGIAAQVSAADIEAERQRLRDEVGKFKAEPVIKLSAGYIF